ncbi:MAG TPA: hypothetical protein DIU15_10570 [Deltaproteobacteria bacterium]|nr:hypothetical protein [Deltaproteobacteria bacterium]HCP46479.1 hypothetical protein [Deltaproteobacteria bacterium]
MMLGMVDSQSAPAKSPAALGIDVGGHGIRAVLVDAAGTVLKADQLTLHGEAERSLVSVEDKIVGLVEQLEGGPGTTTAERLPLPVGIGIPGFQDRHDQVIRSSPNFPGWVDIPVGQRLSERLGRPVSVENDANCALLGEAWVGAARAVQDVVLLTLGTGVGTGFLVGGTLVRGQRGAAGEGGHITLHPNGRSCGCGRLGCLETYASGPGLVATARELWSSDKDSDGDGPTTAQSLFLQVSQGSTPALKAMERWCDDLGRGLASLIHIFAPGAVVLSGGITANFPLFQEPLERAVLRHAIPACVHGLLPLRCSELGRVAGAVGAAFAALNPDRPPTPSP